MTTAIQYRAIQLNPINKLTNLGTGETLPSRPMRLERAQQLALTQSPVLWLMDGFSSLPLPTSLSCTHPDTLPL